MDTLPPHAQEGNIPERLCKGCDTVYLATLEFFPPEKKGKYGLSSRCRECARKKQKKHRSKPEVRERRNAHLREWHSRPEVQEQQRAYYDRPEIRERTNTYHRNYNRLPHAQKRIKSYNQRPDVKQRVRDFYNTPAQKARKQRYSREYNSRPEVQEQQRVYSSLYYRRPNVRERRLAWYHARYALPETRARMSVIRHNRRARLRNAPGTHTRQEVRAQYDRQKGQCYYCRKKVEWYAFHLDHVVPLSRGGSNDISNLVVSCKECNLKKKARLPHEFFEGGRLL